MAFTLEQQRAIAIAEAEAAAKGAGASPQPSSQMTSGLAELSAMTQAPKTGMHAAAPEAANQRAVNQYMAMPAWKRRLTDAIDLPSLVATGGSQGLLDKAAAAVRAPFTDKTYREELAINRRQTEDTRARQGWLGTGAELYGSIGGGLGISKNAAPLLEKGIAKVSPKVSALISGAFTAAPKASKTTKAGKAAVRAAIMGGEGSAYGAANAFGTDQDVSEGAEWGGLFGFGGSGLGDIISTAGSKLGKGYTNYVAPAAQRAKQAVYDAAERIGFDKIDDMFTRHGPDTMNVDVLGQRGYDIGRNAANYSPEADELLKETMKGRKDLQNPRVAAKLREAGEIPEATTYETLKTDVFNKQKPAINRAYEEAKAVGADLPYGPFEDILKSPLGEKAYAEAGQSLLNRAAAEGGGVNASANSELARLDLTARKLNDIATEAFRQGKNSLGGEARELEKALKQRIAASIAGPEWRGARDLRRTAGQIDESFDLGANLAKPNIPLDLPSKAAAAASPKAVAQAYAAEMQERLLNKQNTEGAINIFGTPMAKEAKAAALGPRAQIVDDALDTERLYEKANKALTGNSTTAKQMIRAGVGGAGISALATGDFDPLNPAWLTQVAGGAALGSGGRKYGPTVINALRSSRIAQEAPYLAELLIQRGIDPTRPIPAGTLEKFSTGQREAIRRAIMLGLIQSNQPAER